MGSSGSERSNRPRRRVGVEHSDVGGHHWLTRKEIHLLTRVMRALNETAHHAGYRDCMPDPDGDLLETLFAFLARPSVVARHASAIANGSEELRAIDAEIARGQVGPPPDGFEFSLLTRMGLAALTEADRSDTAAFHDPDAPMRRGSSTDWAILAHTLAAHGVAMDTAAARSTLEFHPERPLLANRNLLRRDCIRAASAPRGLFRVTAPVGLGKTLSVMQFAILHAQNNAIVHRGVRVPMDRVIWVTPHITVTSQVAGVFRTVFGANEVLEHHSGVIDHHPSGSKAYVAARDRTRLMLARENWHGPRIVVSTIHQLFESLMASTPSKLRKIRALRNAIIVIDEAQGLPTDFMQQIVSDLNALMVNWRSSVVLCTATQPPMRSIPWKKFSGLRPSTEIVGDPVAMFRATYRVTMRLHDALVPVRWQGLAAALLQHPSLLCIVNETRQARLLHESLLDQGAASADTYILTARICVAHRNALLDEIRAKLDAGHSIRVVSTSLIEAGVDIDFPVVYRALGGLDQIAQAVGRCNREWRRASGTFVLFASKDFASGERAAALASTRAIIADVTARGDPLDRILDQEMFDRFFGARDRAANLDRQGVYARMGAAVPAGRLPNLRTAGMRARLISDDTVTVITPWGGGDAERRLRAALDPVVATASDEPRMFAAIQGQSIGLPRRTFDRLQAEGGVEARLDGAVWLIRDGHYDPVYGALRRDR